MFSPHAVVIIIIDLSKAYNRGSHVQVIQDLYDMHVPGWLLAILVSYLTGRSMVLKYDGCWFKPRQMPGGYPQGCFLGMFFFHILFNGACLRPNIPKPFTPNPSQPNTTNQTNPTTIGLPPPKGTNQTLPDFKCVKFIMIVALQPQLTSGSH